MYVTAYVLIIVHSLVLYIKNTVYYNGQLC